MPAPTPTTHPTDTLAARVRAKYPGAYDDLDDATLERQVRAKFPGVYDDLPRSGAATPRTLSEPEFDQVKASVLAALPPGLSEAEFNRIVGPRLTAALREAETRPPTTTAVMVDGTPLSLDAYNQTQQTPSAPARTWTDTLRDTIGGVRAGAASTVYGGGDLIRRATGMERIIDRPNVRALMTPPDSTAGRVGMTGEQIGEFFLPTGVLGKGAKAAEVVKAGLLTAAQTGGDPTATAAAAGLTAVLPGGGALKKASSALETSAVETMANSLKATKEWAKAEAERLAPEMLRRGVGGSIKTLRETAGTMAAKAGQNLAQAYAAAAAAGETVPGHIVRGNLQLASDALHTIAANGQRLAVPGNDAAIAQLDALETFVSRLKADIPVDQAAAIKTQFDDIIERAGLFGAKAMASASEKAQGWSFKKASDSFRRLLNTNPTIADLNQEASFWIGLRDVAAATKLRRVGQSGGLIRTIAGGAGAAAGAATSGPIGALVGSATAHQLATLVQSPAWMNRVSAPAKDALATALASGNAARIAGAVRRVVASLPADLRQSVATE